MDSIALTLVALGGLLLLGLAADWLGRRTRVPRVTALMLLGLVAGPAVLDLVPAAVVELFPAVAAVALVMVGFLIGGEFDRTTVRGYGRNVATIAAIEGVVTAVVVGAGLLVIGIDLTSALLLAGVAAATDAAATVAVVQEETAPPRPAFAQTLLGVVGLDDVFSLTIFSLLAVVAGVAAGSGSGALVAEGLWEIGGAVLVGVALGLPAAALTGRIGEGEPSREEAVGVVLLCAGLSLWLGASFILAAVVLGLVVVNRAHHHTRPFREIENVEGPVLVLFFLLAGASLDPSVLPGAGLLLVAYVLLRGLGKVVGGRAGAARTGTSVATRRWMGAALLPQGGVALGLALVAAHRFPEVADTLLAVVVAGTVVFELVGPVMTRQALSAVRRADGPVDPARPALTVPPRPGPP